MCHEDQLIVAAGDTALPALPALNVKRTEQRQDAQCAHSEKRWPAIIGEDVSNSPGCVAKAEHCVVSGSQSLGSTSFITKNTGILKSDWSGGATLDRMKAHQQRFAFA